MNLVTLEDAARHLRLDDLDDPEIEKDLEDKLLWISHAIVDYLQVKDVSPWFNSAGEPEFVPGQVRLGTLIWLGIVWKNRDGESDETMREGYIPFTVSNFLWRTKRFSYA